MKIIITLEAKEKDIEVIKHEFNIFVDQLKKKVPVKEVKPTLTWKT